MEKLTKWFKLFTINPLFEDSELKELYFYWYISNRIKSMLFVREESLIDKTTDKIEYDSAEYISWRYLIWYQKENTLLNQWFIIELNEVIAISKEKLKEGALKLIEAENTKNKESFLKRKKELNKLKNDFFIKIK